MRGVSVIICCHNSAKRLPKTLEHLANQKVNEAVNWEVIIVNNASTDNTKEVALAEWKRYLLNVPFQIVDEPVPGLSYARENGIKTAVYEYLLFCDDDNWLSERYVQTVHEIMTKESQIGALGGWGQPEFESKPEYWIEANAGIFATGKQSEKSGELIQSFHVYGAGCTYRKSALDKLKQVGFKNILTGRIGGKLLAGDDHELCYALRLSGYAIWYDERLSFKHFIPSARAAAPYVKEMILGFAISSVYLLPYKLRISNHGGLKTSWVFGIMMRLYLLIKKYGLSKIILSFFKKQNHQDVNFFYEWNGFLMLVKSRSEYFNSLRRVYNYQF